MGLTLSSPECCSSACGRERLEAALRFAELFASGFACYLHERSTLPHPFRIPLFLPPHPHKGPRRPAAPHRRTGRRLCFWFIAPQQAAGVRAPAGAARLSQRVYTVCAGVPFAPSREMRFWECLEVEDRVGPGNGEFGWGGATLQGLWVPSDSGQTSREEAGDREGVREGVAGAGPAPPGPSTRHWKMLASLPPSETRCESSCVNRTLVTWLP